ncbi:MAG: TatD family hydrolase [Deferrisomatales bacterium]
MFDTHVHFDAETEPAAVDEAASRARRAGVTGAVNPAVDLATSRRTLEIHGRHPWVLPALGIHPLRLETDPPLGELELLAAGGAYAAVGEVGLDFWHGRHGEDRQRAALLGQAALARRLGLPILLHVRKALYDAFAVLREAGFDGPGVCHAFTGSRDMARLALDRGFYLSAGSALTYPNRGRLRELFRWAPRDRIVVETDAPDLPPWSRRGQGHRPEDLPLTVSALARALGVAPEEAAAVTEANARRLFGRGRSEP